MVDAVTSTTTSATAASQAVSTSTSTGVTEFDDFLTLLTAQLENQDPLEPLDSTQFVEQLATFTGVEQQIASNSKLDTLIELSQGDTYRELGSWVGRDVTASDPVFEFNGSALQILIPEDEGAERASVVIRDGLGDEVTTLTADPGDSLTWNGTTKDGGAAPAGSYTISFVYSSGEGEDAVTRTVPADGEGQVVEARLTDGAIELVLSNGAIVRPENVSAVREAQPEADPESA